MVKALLPVQLFKGLVTDTDGTCDHVITMSSVTVVLPQPPDPVLDRRTVREPLDEVGWKPQAVMVPPPFIRLPVPVPPPSRLHDQEPGDDADAPRNITLPVPH